MPDRTSSIPLPRLFPLKPIDYFVFFNTILFSIMCCLVYWRRFLQFKGHEALPEFAFYAFVIYAGIAAGWMILRKYRIPWSILIGVELMVLVHFAAGMLMPGGMRLYDLTCGPVRLDKFVHFLNSLIGCYVAAELFEVMGARFGNARLFVTVFIVLGAGAIIEIVEYLVVLHIPHNGVGDYDNNMQDLIANLAGGLAYAGLQAIHGRLSASENPQRSR